ncbi:MAG: hypothetical protein AAFZ10_05930 [Pseudomonadota bacterium]
MPKQTPITRRAALATALGLSLAPIALASSAAARGGPDPWRPKRKKKGAEDQRRPEAPRDR